MHDFEAETQWLKCNMTCSFIVSTQIAMQNLNTIVVKPRDLGEISIHDRLRSGTLLSLLRTFLWPDQFILVDLGCRGSFCSTFRHGFIQGLNLGKVSCHILKERVKTYIVEPKHCSFVFETTLESTPKTLNQYCKFI